MVVIKGNTLKLISRLFRMRECWCLGCKKHANKHLKKIKKRTIEKFLINQI